MKKSILSALIACCMLASATGCSDKSDSKDDKKSSSKADTTTVADEEAADGDESSDEEKSDTTTVVDEEKSDTTTVVDEEAADDDESSDEEKSDTESGDAKDGKIVIDRLAGKKLSELIDEGFHVYGYMTSSNKAIVYLENKDYEDDILTEFADSLNGKTVKELVDKYDISVGYFGFNGEYTFTSTIGTLTVDYDIEHGVEAIENHSDESFFDLEDAEEIQSDVLENVKLSRVSFELALDEASSKKLTDAEDLDVDYIEDIADELVVSEVYYKLSNPANLFL